MYIEPPDDERATTDDRRGFLRTAGALASAGIASSLAGCAGGGGGGDRGEQLPTLTVTGYPPSNKNVHGTLQLIVEACNDAGFDLEYEGMNRERQLSKTYFEQNYDITSLGYTGRPNRLDPHMLMYKNYHSSQTDNGNYNWTNFQNEAVDEALDEQARILDREERQTAVKEAQEVIMETPGGEIPIEHDALVNVYNSAQWEGFVEVAGIGLKNIWTWTQVEPKQDKELLTAAFPLEIPHITPLQANESNLITNRLVHDRLLRVSPEGLPEPWVATDFTVSDDNTVIEMPLRDDVSFHDGEQLTADDVVFTYRFLKEYENPFFSSAVKPIETVEKTGEYGVRFTLSEPFAPIFMLAFARVHILPQHIWTNVPEEVGVEKPFQWSPTSSEYGLVGSGPYEFQEWRKGEGILLAPNEEHPVAAPNVGELFLRSVGNPSAMLTGLKNGDIDFAIRASSIETAALEEAVENNDQLTMKITNSVGYDEWSMNTNQEPLDDPAIRGAMASLIPRETIVNEVWNGYAEVAVSPTSPVLDFWHNADVTKWHTMSSDETASMLEEAGYVVGDDAIYYGENQPETES
jgi:peptide/nickel transport system substrate-binding protein